MKIVKQNYRCKCNVNNCRNNADYCITGEGVMPEKRINICRECAGKIFAELGGILKKEVKNG